MKKYIAFDFDLNGYVRMYVLSGNTKYEVADKYTISRNNIYQYDLIKSMFNWLYHNTNSYYYFFKDNTNDYLYLYNRNRNECEPVRKMITIKNALKAYFNRQVGE